MKNHLLSYSLIACSASASTFVAAEEPFKKAYTPPSRGFFLEQGKVNTGDHISIDLHSGANGLQNGGSIRLGLSQAELILNSGLGLNTASTGNDVSLKWGLPPIRSGDQQTTDQFAWSLVTGLSVIDFDNSNNDQTNLKLGVAATISADAATFTLTPSLIYSDIADNSDTFLELGLGAYAGLIDTESGLFSIGAEVVMSTQDDSDTTALVGTRWSYNERVNIDIIPMIFSNSDILGIPGLVRLNVVF
ncbi:hypothetical protein A3752_12960 [Oleiphilus sp. HI0081]|uniref:hypothetical protein n=1 Tax=unclassified Oleiphilus TaxID=2631174 RepID=UPI0007C2937F|nr:MULTISPECIES: hypothetical protein [unclassified Oleiphilus]KZY77677.1 hypothetical protein A3741_09090 [Oleiphilus sp. HI0069]KZY84061.1 hypothetical protein A3740_00565 [Oleiphilus sp. HI0068]KZY89086.1 hypothetical protein A3743_09295 [Oleiphilus sp. HI0072]KZZ13055.1 hypothetical protein A3749_05970 [Oleiphilus sp. HI0078]KZZ20005.1 hypothetical protein A3752_12960 [Oleiphilus sp. HI0081]